MNRALPEMMHYLNTTGTVVGVKGMELSVLERQKMILNWQQEQLFQVQPHHQQQQQQQQLSCFNDLNILSFLPAEAQDFRSPNMNYGPNPVTTGPTLNEHLNRPIKADPNAEHGWMDFEMPKSGVTVGSLGFESADQVQVHNNIGYAVNYGISRTTSSPPSVAAAAASVKAANEAKARESIPTDHKLSGSAGRESFKKRKAERNLSTPKVEEDSKSKKSKGCVEEEESKITEQHTNSSQSNPKESNGNKIDKKNKESSGCTSKDNSKASEVQKPDYIHVRARRGQATDSHSLAERVRREKISERMKYLQDLVPGCNKITGKAGMLDEIINYVQSLQRQVEFLSMKLAAVNPRLDFSLDDLIAKEVLAACSTNLPTIGVSPDVTNPNYLQHHPIEQMDPVCGSTVAVNQVDLANLGLRRTISAPLSIPETFLDTAGYNQISNSSQWDANIQNIYNMEIQQGRSIFPLQTFTGTIEGSSLKMEM